MLQAEKNRVIAELKARIANHESGAETERPSFLLGLPEVDQVLPDGGLRLAALHEVAAAAYRDMGAATGFLISLIIRASRDVSLPVLWCETAKPPFDMGRLYGPGLSAFGMEPERLIHAFPASDADCLWTIEEALRSRAFSIVVGEIDGRSPVLSLAATRRLQLAAEASGVPAVLFTGHAKEGASVAVTRWHIASARSSPVPYVAPEEKLPGAPRWKVELSRARGGKPASWLLEWNAMKGAFTAVSQAEENDGARPALTASPSALPLRQIA